MPCLWDAHPQRWQSISSSAVEPGCVIAAVSGCHFKLPDNSSHSWSLPEMVPNNACRFGFEACSFQACRFLYYALSGKEYYETEAGLVELDLDHRYFAAALAASSVMDPAKRVSLLQQQLHPLQLLQHGELAAAVVLSMLVATADSCRSQSLIASTINRVYGSAALDMAAGTAKEVEHVPRAVFDAQLQRMARWVRIGSQIALIDLQSSFNCQ